MKAQAIRIEGRSVRSAGHAVRSAGQAVPPQPRDDGHVHGLRPLERKLLFVVPVSKARPVYPGAVVFTTRRVHKRQLLLRPSKRINQLIEYVVAVLATRYRIQLHALCVLSNHVHDVASDPDGRIVELRRDLHALLARAVNAMHGDFESVWAREPTCRVICVEPDDALDKVAYTMANPVAARLVEHGHSWPGVRCAWPKRPRTIKRPPGFFRDEDEGWGGARVVLDWTRRDDDGRTSRAALMACR